MTRVGEGTITHLVMADSETAAGVGNRQTRGIAARLEQASLRPNENGAKVAEYFSLLK